MAGHHFIFVAGLHRSGTSLLHKILCRHEKISGFSNTGVPEDEGQFLQSVYQPARNFRGPGKFGLAAESYMDEAHILATQNNAERMFKEWSSYWNLESPYLIEKSPPNIMKSRFLQKLFPNSMFIMIVRHPIAVAYATKKWSDTDIDSLIDHTLFCYERFFKDLPLLKKAYILRYEDMVGDTGRAIEDIFSFVGLPKVEVMDSEVVNANIKYFEMWEKDRKSLFKQFAAKRTIRKYEARANRLGYSLKNPELLFPFDQLGEHAL